VQVRPRPHRGGPRARRGKIAAAPPNPAQPHTGASPIVALAIRTDGRRCPAEHPVCQPAAPDGSPHRPDSRLHHPRMC